MVRQVSSFGQPGMVYHVNHHLTVALTRLEMGPYKCKCEDSFRQFS